MLTPQPFPSLIKYMGSKTKIIDFIVDGINFIHQQDRPILDLFAGSASLAGAIGKQVNFVSNDIQEYSKVLSQTYLVTLLDQDVPDIDYIYQHALNLVQANVQKEYIVDYGSLINIDNFNALEEFQKDLINKDTVLTQENEEHLIRVASLSMDKGCDVFVTTAALPESGDARLIVEIDGYFLYSVVK